MWGEKSGDIDVMHENYNFSFVKMTKYVKETRVVGRPLMAFRCLISRSTGNKKPLKINMASIVSSMLV